MNYQKNYDNYITAALYAVEAAATGQRPHSNIHCARNGHKLATVEFGYKCFCLATFEQAQLLLAYQQTSFVLTGHSQTAKLDSAASCRVKHYYIVILLKIQWNSLYLLYIHYRVTFLFIGPFHFVIKSYNILYKPTPTYRLRRPIGL
jgi:hypothetical protein